MYTPTDDINLCPGGYVRYYNQCNNTNHDLGGVIILVLGGWGWYETCRGGGGGGGGDGAINLVLGDECGGGGNYNPYPWGVGVVYVMSRGRYKS